MWPELQWHQPKLAGRGSKIVHSSYQLWPNCLAGVAFEKVLEFSKCAQLPFYCSDSAGANLAFRDYGTLMKDTAGIDVL